MIPGKKKNQVAVTGQESASERGGVDREREPHSNHNDEGSPSDFGKLGKKIKFKTLYAYCTIYNQLQDRLIETMRSSSSRASEVSSFIHALEQLDRANQDQHEQEYQLELCKERQFYSDLGW